MIVLVLGGARSGKSAYAERRAASFPEPVSYVATACVDGDADLAARVDQHRARRPESWTTIEAGPDVPRVLRGDSRDGRGRRARPVGRGRAGL